MVTGLRTASLLVATICIGAIAGVFFTYAVAVMPGLRRTDDRTFVAAFQSIDRSIERPPTFVALFGGLGSAILAAVLYVGADERSPLGWIIAACVLYAAVILITGTINVPRNTAIKAAGNPDTIDLAAVRARFDEALWIRWNQVRLALNLAAFACITWSLVLHGRST